MYFDNFKQHADAQLNTSLLWEYDMSDFDFLDMKSIVIQRVIERGWPDDWYAMLNKYGVELVVETIKTLPYLNDKDMNFVKIIFDIPLTEMQCYKNKQSKTRHWNS